MTMHIPRGKSDEVIEKIMAALGPFERARPEARIDLYRQNSVSVRIRIVDPQFGTMSKPQRSQFVWKYLGTLPDDVQSDISTVILLTPEEMAMSFANFEFEDPVASQL